MSYVYKIVLVFYSLLFFISCSSDMRAREDGFILTSSSACKVLSGQIMAIQYSDVVNSKQVYISVESFSNTVSYLSDSQSCTVNSPLEVDTILKKFNGATVCVQAGVNPSLGTRGINILTDEQGQAGGFGTNDPSAENIILKDQSYAQLEIEVEEMVSSYEDLAQFNGTIPEEPGSLITCTGIGTQTPL